MSTQRIQYSTKSRLPCGCVPGAGVILCVSNSLTLEGDGIIYASIVSEQAGQDPCSGNTFTYIFSFNDEQLAANKILNSSGINGAFCEGCLTKWVESLLSGGGEGGDDWHILGNSATVDGTNFAGTTDNVAYDIRVNNERAGRFQPAQSTFPSESAPDVIFGYSGNRVETGGGGNSILGGGKPEGENIIYAFPFQISSFNVIGGGHSNYLDNHSDECFIGGGSQNHISAGINCVIVGGNNSFFTNERYDFIGGGQNNSIVNLSWYSFIGGGDNNTIDFSGGSGVVSGSSHTIDAANWGDEVRLAKNFIGGGDTNHIENCDSSVISGGISNVLGASTGRTFYSVIGGGQANAISISDDILYACNTNIIAGGYQNNITDSVSSVISGGNTNEILLGYNSNISGGSNNHIEALNSALISGMSIGGGDSNNVTLATLSGVAAGFRNTITHDPDVEGTGSEYNFIGGGIDNQITGEDEVLFSHGNGILGGDLNGIFDSTNSAILGGSNNKIQDGVGSSILGGTHILLGTHTCAFQGTPGSAGVGVVDLTAFSEFFYIGNCHVAIGNTDNGPRRLMFYEANTALDLVGANFSSFEAQNQAADIQYVLPATAGVAGQSLKIQSVAGPTVTLEWA